MAMGPSLALDDPEILPLVDDDRYEIVDDLRVELPPLGAYESWLASRLSISLGSHVEEQRLGHVAVETLFQLRAKPKLQRRPDAAFVSGRRWPLDDPPPFGTNAWEVVPDLAIEVVSPTNTAFEIPARSLEYFQAGVRLVWQLYPNVGMIYIYTSPKQIQVLDREDILDGGELLPGFILPVSRIFPFPRVVEADTNGHQGDLAQ
jgi:Uma2 family endonuclease